MKHYPQKIARDLNDKDLGAGTRSRSQLRFDTKKQHHTLTRDSISKKKVYSCFYHIIYIVKVALDIKGATTRISL
jgi:hypothetical protein